MEISINRSRSIGGADSAAEFPALSIGLGVGSVGGKSPSVCELRLMGITQRSSTAAKPAKLMGLLM